MNSESKERNEGELTFDIRFFMRTRDAEKIKVIVIRRNPSYNKIFEYDSYYKAFCTYQYYKDRVGLGRELDKMVISVDLIR